MKEYQAEIEIKDAPEKVRKLKPGMTAEIRIIVEDRKEPVLQIPVQSVVSFSGEYYTYVAGPSVAAQRKITVGDSNDEFMEVLSGLEEGERVIMNPRTHFSKELSVLEAEAADKRESERPKFETPKRDGAVGPVEPVGMVVREAEVLAVQAARAQVARAQVVLAAREAGCRIRRRCLTLRTKTRTA